MSGLRCLAQAQGRRLLRILQLWGCALPPDPSARRQEWIMRMLMTVIVLLGAVSLAACNTMRGIGQDIEKAGDTIERAAHR
jgi:predicted small secreted protein